MRHFRYVNIKPAGCPQFFIWLENIVHIQEMDNGGVLLTWIEGLKLQLDCTEAVLFWDAWQHD